MIVNAAAQLGHKRTDNSRPLTPTPLEYPLNWLQKVRLDQMVKHHPSPLNRDDLLQPNCRNDDWTGFMLTGTLTLWLQHLEEFLVSPKGGETSSC